MVTPNDKEKYSLVPESELQPMLPMRHVHLSVQLCIIRQPNTLGRRHQLPSSDAHNRQVIFRGESTESFPAQTAGPYFTVPRLFTLAKNVQHNIPTSLEDFCGLLYHQCEVTHLRNHDVTLLSLAAPATVDRLLVSQFTNCERIKINTATQQNRCLGNSVHTLYRNFSSLELVLILG